MKSGTSAVHQGTFSIIEHEWVPLSDGTCLAVRIWMPDGADNVPVPAVLNFLPYRKRNGTSKRDEADWPVLARAGIAVVRADLRGTGESEGLHDDEFTQELPDAVEIIAWIAAQPWCSGKVGMMGISWGGGNTLRTAALRPPALKAVIACSCSIDRFRTALRYKGGAYTSLNLSWHTTMLSEQSRAPDPQIVGDRWLDMWRQRLQEQPYLKTWLSHQRRDAYWRHASINEDFNNFPVPALFAAGWSDGYRDSGFDLIEGLPDKGKALVGPWAHQYPNRAFPGPGADFLNEAVAWWNHWLRDEPSGVENTPQLRAYILDGPRPTSQRKRVPGFWISKKKWTSPEVRKVALNASRQLVDHPLERPSDRFLLRSPLATGTAGGELWGYGNADHMASDQRLDDEGSLVLESAPLHDECILLGKPSLQLTLSSDSPLANVAARLIDVHPDGTAMRISYGVLNLAHRMSDSKPTPLVPGKDETVTIMLDASGYRIAPGHRIRLSISTAYWPMIASPPYDATLNIELSSVNLSLPLLGKHERTKVAEPSNTIPLPTYQTLEAGEERRWFERNLENGTTNSYTISDTGLIRHPGNGLAERLRQEEKWSITAQDPLSQTAECHFTANLSREGWETVTKGFTKQSCTKTEWIISDGVEAFYNGQKIFSRERTMSIPRDCT